MAYLEIFLYLMYSVVKRTSKSDVQNPILLKRKDDFMHNLHKSNHLLKFVTPARGLKNTMKRKWAQKDTERGSKSLRQ